VLVDGHGRTLYTFAPDHAKKVTCVGGCATVWPPMTSASASASAAKATTAGQVKTSLVSSDPNPSGGRVVTYAGWPLYTYVGDHGTGSANGQALNINGGYWWVITPAGAVVTKSARASSGASTNSSGGGGYGY
jgi:predicted lipoprotein with Yx(FWY)xxD motif